MQDVLLVHVVQRHHDLHKPVEQLRLGDERALLLVCIEALLEVAAVAVLHEEKELRARRVHVHVRHHVRVRELLQQLRLLQRALPLLVVESRELHALHDALAAGGFLPAQEHRSVRALAQFADRLVAIEGWHNIPLPRVRDR